MPSSAQIAGYNGLSLSHDDGPLGRKYMVLVSHDDARAEAA
jgi:hypothetical protein